MKKKIKLSFLTFTLALSTALLTGCSGVLVGDENLSEPVKLAANPNAVSLQGQWKKSIGKGTDKKTLKLQPFVTSANVYAVSNDGKLFAFKRKTGQQIWKRRVGHRIASGVSGDDNILTIGSENGLVMAFAAGDGKPLWRYQLSSEIMAAPTVKGGLVVARSIDGQVVALSADRGSVVWKQHIGTAPLSIRGNSQALYFDNVFLFTNGTGRLTVLSAINGKPMLDSPVSRGRGITAIQRITDLLATPEIRNGKLFVSAYRNETLAIDLKNGSLLWRSDLATALDLFADNHFVYIADKNSIIHALSTQTGEVAWTSKVLEGRRISPISGNGRHIATVDNEGNLVVLDSRDGSLLSHRKVGSKRTYVAPQWHAGSWLTYTGSGKLASTRME